MGSMIPCYDCEYVDFHPCSFPCCDCGSKEYKQCNTEICKSLNKKCDKKAKE